MDFKTRKGGSSEPEINLIPFIDVLLVVLIFLMLSTTYSRFAQIGIELPQADAVKVEQAPKSLVLVVKPDGSYVLAGHAIDGSSAEKLAQALSGATKGDASVSLVVAADADAKHQWVMRALESAQKAGLSRVAFESMQTKGGAAR